VAQAGILKIEEGSGLSALLGEVALRLTTYATAMNNPWLSLIAALSGQRINTPSTWPVREVHRLFEVRATRPAEGRPLRPSDRHRGPWS
jgi:hypothetical protein